MDDSLFTLVGVQSLSASADVTPKRKWHQGKPMVSIVVLSLIILGCLFCEGFIPKDPAYMDLTHHSIPPGQVFWFGTDAMGRDIFSMVWYGGRVSLLIGFLSASISTLIAVLVGSISGLGPPWLDSMLMRLTDVLLSVPGLLLIVLLQAVLGKPNVLSISFVIGATNWTSMAKVVRTEVRRMRSSQHIIAAKCMGGSFLYILLRHLTPGFLPPILFMVIMNIGSAITAESTLSFMGIGLPLEVISWGSMLSLAGNALLSDSWWIVLTPGVFLITALLCLTNIGSYLQNRSQKHSNL